MAKHFCCPKCGNKNLQSTTETVTQTSGKNYSGTQGCLGLLLFGPMGLLCGLCGQGKTTNTNTTNYWVCPNCGHKFRSPDDIRKDKSNGSAFMGIMVGLGLCLGLLFFIFFAVSGALYDEGLIVIPTISLCIIGGTAALGAALKKVFDSESEKAEMEAQKLEREMAKFKNEEIKQPEQPAPVKTNSTVNPEPVQSSEAAKPAAESSQTNGNDTVECLFCSQLIDADAKFCKHCGRRQD